MIVMAAEAGAARRSDNAKPVVSSFPVEKSRLVHVTVGIQPGFPERY
jgi:hypothetical protein